MRISAWDLGQLSYGNLKIGVHFVPAEEDEGGGAEGERGRRLR